MKHPQKLRLMNVVVQTLLPIVLSSSPAVAEMRTITATGEYRMGDNDTRTDAKRLALLDAKRLALEQAGTYIESITQIKNFDLSTEELRAYTAGIVEVTELDTKDVLEGATHIMRVEVTAKIDTDVVARQIDALRKNELTKAELTKLRAEREQLKQEIEAKTRELAAAKSRPEANRVRGERSKLLNDAQSQEMLIHAILLSVQEEERPGSLQEAKQIAADVAALNPSNPDPLVTLGFIHVVSKEYETAAKYYRKAVELEPRAAETHYHLAGALLALAKRDEGIAELRTAIKLDPNYAEAHAGLGALLGGYGKTDEAVREFRIASQLAPHDATYHAVLGRFLDKDGRTLEALAEYEESLELVQTNRLENLKLENLMMDRDVVSKIRNRVQLLLKELDIRTLNCKPAFYTLTPNQKLRFYESVASVDDKYQALSREVRQEVKRRLLSQTTPPESCSAK